MTGPHVDLTISDGIVEGWGGNCINAGSLDHGRFEHLSIGSSGIDGLIMGSNSTVLDLSVSGSGAAAIHVSGGQNRIEGCHATASGAGLVVDGTNNLIIRKSSAGNGVDYNIVAGNAFGPIVNVGGVGDISTVVGANHPWANFSLTCSPIAELCDGANNDCDTLVDEDFTNLGASCSVGIGVCQAAGTFICSLNQLSTECSATPGSPTIEVCDGLDNDCDGTSDEGNPGCGASEACCAGTCVNMHERPV